MPVAAISSLVTLASHGLNKHMTIISVKNAVLIDDFLLIRADRRSGGFDSGSGALGVFFLSGSAANFGGLINGMTCVFPAAIAASPRPTTTGNRTIFRIDRLNSFCSASVVFFFFLNPFLLR